MIASKGWDWKIVGDDVKSRFMTPSVESYYLLHRWKDKGYKRFLDLGCGLGRHSILFLQNGFDVSAFDISDEAIRSITVWAKELGLKPDCKVGDMLSLPYEDHSIDCIISYNVISHSDTAGVNKVVSELRRVLKPGGECYLTLCSKASNGFTQNWPSVDRNTKLKMIEGPEYRVPHFYADYDLIMDLFSGFRIISVSHVENYHEKEGSIHSSYHYHVLVKNERTEEGEPQ